MKEATLQYNPYRGPAGPSKTLAEKNTLCLAFLLKEEGIPYTEDREYAMQMWGSPDLLLKIVDSESGEDLYAGYDRWGFVVDGMEEIDQCDLKETLQAIKERLKKG